jgi:hypothetical protein
MSSLRPADRVFLEQILEMRSGYVLSFSNASFKEFVHGSTGEDIYSEQYAANGDSKANRMRAFWSVAPDPSVALLLDNLLTVMLDSGKLVGTSPEAARLRGIVRGLRGAVGESQSPEPNGAMDRRARAFISYSVERKHAGAAVKGCLAGHGYRCFLAHEDLHVSEEWKQRILDELRESDVFVAVLSKEFKDSKWCGQEVGFIVSRPDVLVVPISVDGTMPYGFIEHLQGTRVRPETIAPVLEEVLFRRRPRQMIPAQIEKVRAAGSYRGAEAVVRPLVPHFALFSDDEVNAFAHAAANNQEVWAAGRCASEFLPEFVRINGRRISPQAASALSSVLEHLDLPQAPR